MEHPRAQGYAMALLIVAIWTGFVVVSRKGGASPMTAWDIIAARYATATIILLSIGLFHRCRPLLDRRMALLALTGGLGCAALAFSGFERTTAAHAAVLLPGLLPFLTALAAWWLLKEMPNRYRWIGLAFIASGVYCLIPDTMDRAASTGQGDLLMVAASTCWADYSVLLRGWNIARLDATFGVTPLTAPAYLPVYWIALPKQIVSVP